MPENHKPVNPVLAAIIKGCFYYFIIILAYVLLGTLLAFIAAIFDLNLFHASFLIQVYPFFSTLFIVAYVFDLIALTVLYFTRHISKRLLFYWRVLLVCLIPVLINLFFYFAFKDFSLPL